MGIDPSKSTINITQSQVPENKSLKNAFDDQSAINLGNFD
jgi:hypothetical protein